MKKEMKCKNFCAKPKQMKNTGNFSTKKPPIAPNYTYSQMSKKSK